MVSAHRRGQTTGAGAGVAPGGTSLADLGAPALAALVGASGEGVLLLDGERRVCHINPAAAAMLGAPATDLVHRDVLAWVAPESRDALRAQLAAVGSEPIGCWIDIAWPPARGEREIEAMASCVESVDRRLVAVLLRDVTAGRRRAREARAIARIAASLTFDQSMEATLATLAASVVDVTRAVACAVALIDEEAGVYRVAGTCGLPAGYAAAVEAAWRAGANLSSIEAYRSRRPVRRTVRDYILRDPNQSTVHHLVRDVSWDSIASVPLLYRDSAVGALSCSYLLGAEPGDDEIAFLLVIADQAAVAVETARLFVEVQGKAALEERQKLARELHDSVSQALYGIALGARTARTLLDRDPARVAEPLDYVLSLADVGMAEMRALIFELRPESLEQEGLVAAIQKHTRAVRARYDVEIETRLVAEPVVELAAKEALYRVVQEATHNTIKHARAGRIEVRLACEEDAGVVLEVVDDGVGFDAGGSFPGHLGLRSMRERIERLGGSLTIASAAGRGTTVRAELRPV
jgi:signal transduction histidine kinase